LATFPDHSQREESISSYALQALRDSEERFRLFVVASSDIVYRMSPDWSQMHYLSGKDFLLDTISPNDSWLTTYIPLEEQVQVQNTIKEAIRDKTMFELEHRVIQQDGTLGWTLSRAVPYINERQEIIEWIGVAVDITPRKRIEEMLYEASRRKDEFLGLLAHELRNPLATLSSALQLVKLTGGEDERFPLDTALTLMNQQVSHLARLIDDLLDVSRINQGKTQLRLQRLNLISLLGDVMEATRLSMDASSRQVSLSLPDEPVYLYADADRLTQVIRNLLSNALKFTAEDGRIWLSLEPTPQQAVLRIVDDGIGIPTHELNRIFDVFAQVDASRTRSESGLGLGLTVVKQFVELHKGRVEAHSAGLDRGSEFIVYLPLAD